MTYPQAHVYELATRREVLDADRTYFVDPVNGDNSRPGFGPGLVAVRSIARAIDLVCRLDTADMQATILLAPGSYSGTITMRVTHGEKPVIIKGAGAETIINGAISNDAGGEWQLHDMLVNGPVNVSTIGVIRYANLAAGGSLVGNGIVAGYVASTPLLNAILSLQPTNDTAMYFTGLESVAVHAQTAFTRQLAGAADAAAARALLAVLALSGGTLTGPLTLAGMPSDPLHATSKSYVDNVAAGLDPKQSARVATTANIALTALQTIDGVVLVDNDRVLVKNQTAPAQNGLYNAHAGAWTRTLDMDDWSEVPGANLFVEQGATHADTGWTCVSDPGGTIGVTAINWVSYGGTGSFQPLNARLTSISNFAATANRLFGHDGAGGASLITLPAAGLALAAGAIALANDLAALEGLAATGFAVRSGADAWAQRSLVPGSNITITNADGVAGNPSIALVQGAARSVLAVAGNATANFAAVQGGANQVLRIDAAGTALGFGAINLASAAAVTGNLPVGNLGSGTGASGATFWRGDGVWATPAGAGDVAGPASSTDRGLAVYSGATGKLLTTCPVLVTAGGDVSGIGTLALTGKITMSGGAGVDAQNVAGGYINPNATSVQWSLETSGGIEGGLLLTAAGVHMGAWSNHPIILRSNNIDRLTISTAGLVRLHAYGAGVLQTDASGNVSSLASIPGTATNDNAAAGKVGEYVSNTAGLGAVALTTSVVANVTSINLSAGDWEVRAAGYFTGNATTTVQLVVNSISGTSGVSDDTLGRYAAHAPGGAAQLFNTGYGVHANPLVPVRVSLNAPATLFLTARADFSVSTCAVGGIIAARRVR